VEVGCAPASLPSTLHHGVHEGTGTGPWHDAMQATAGNRNASWSLRRLGRGKKEKEKRMTGGLEGVVNRSFSGHLEIGEFSTLREREKAVCCLARYASRQARTSPLRNISRTGKTFTFFILHSSFFSLLSSPFILHSSFFPRYQSDSTEPRLPDPIRSMTSRKGMTVFANFHCVTVLSHTQNP
jgi:hypothetical protein